MMDLWGKLKSVGNKSPQGLCRVKTSEPSGEIHTGFLPYTPSIFSNQFPCMTFKRLTYCKRLRDVECCMWAMSIWKQEAGSPATHWRMQMKLGICRSTATLPKYRYVKLAADRSMMISTWNSKKPLMLWIHQQLTSVCRFFRGPNSLKTRQL